MVSHTMKGKICSPKKEFIINFTLITFIFYLFLTVTLVCAIANPMTHQGRGYTTSTEATVEAACTTATVLFLRQAKQANGSGFEFRVSL